MHYASEEPEVEGFRTRRVSQFEEESRAEPAWSVELSSEVEHLYVPGFILPP